MALVGGVAHPSSDAVVGVNGLSFKAHYNGDATYLPSDGVVAVDAEQVVVVDGDGHPCGCGASDQASAAAILSAAIGSTVHDKATVSGALTTPTGTVDFTCIRTRLTALGHPGCGDGCGACWWCGASVVGCGCGCEWSVVQGALQRERDLSGLGRCCEPLTPNKLSSQTVTDIHAGAGASDQASAAAILSAAIGSTVHDKAIPPLPFGRAFRRLPAPRRRLPARRSRTRPERPRLLAGQVHGQLPPVPARPVLPDVEPLPGARGGARPRGTGSAPTCA